MAENKAKQKSKSSWALQLSFLFVFLAGGGYYAYINMNKEAHKLVGGDKYADMTKSQMYNSEFSSSKRNFFFSREEEVLSDNNTKNKNSSSASSPSASLSKVELGAASSKMAGISGDNSDEDSEKEGSSNIKSSSVRGHLSSGLKKKLAIKKDRVYSGKGGTPKTSGAFIATSRGEVTLKEGEDTTSKKGRTVATQKTSVMESLKKTWKTGIYGARDASRDKARNWIARVFDNIASSRYSLEYEENMKRDLDRIDPNSIPGYLRDMDVSKSSAKSLGIKDVGLPKTDVEGTKEALAVDVKYQAAKLANEASDGMLNSLFSGMDFGNDENPTNQNIGDYGDDGPTNKNLPPPADPEDPPDFFDDEIMEFNAGGCGEECGCTCEAACCCLPPDYFNNTGDFPPPDPNLMWA